MWLAVDCGNSRAKWALIKDDGIVNIQSAALGRWEELQRAARRAAEAWVSHVGMAVTRRELRAILQECPQIHFVKSESDDGGGVINTYRPPAALGVDRWLGLVAAREQQRDLIIISVGTAATVDLLRADGVFIGGAILPGLRMAQQVLTKHVGVRSSMRGDLQLPPLTTNDAVMAGALLSVIGTATMLRRRLLPGARFLATGGNAPQLLPHLPRSAMHVPHLPIYGLICWRRCCL